MTMEVLALVMHFLITLCILGGYLFTVAKGQPDETLKNLLMVIGGYWFGAIGKQMWSSRSTTKNDSSTGNNGSNDPNKGGGST